MGRGTSLRHYSPHPRFNRIRIKNATLAIESTDLNTIATVGTYNRDFRVFQFKLQNFTNSSDFLFRGVAGAEFGLDEAQWMNTSIWAVS